MLSGLCKEINHNNILKYYYKNHNTLCCAACLSKNKWTTLNCNVCLLAEIVNEKKKENIK